MARGIPIVRQYPFATVDFLRYQIGEMRERPSMMLRNKVMVFHMLGFGSTLKKAKDKAGIEHLPSDVAVTPAVVLPEAA